MLVKVISGKANGVDSVKELAYTPVWLLDVEIKPGGKIVQALPKGWNAFAYVLDGAARFGKDRKVVGEFHIVVFEEDGDSVSVEVAEDAKQNGHFGECLSVGLDLGFPDLAFFEGWFANFGVLQCWLLDSLWIRIS